MDLSRRYGKGHGVLPLLTTACAPPPPIWFIQNTFLEKSLNDKTLGNNGKRNNNVQNVTFSFDVFSNLFKIAGQQLLVQKCDAIIRLTVLTRLYRRVCGIGM